MNNFSWKVKGRRGRPAARRNQLDPELVLAAQTLMLISRSGGATDMDVPGPSGCENPNTSSSSASSSISEAANIPPNSEKYQCDKCPRVFRSHQALGGHQTCHRPKDGGASATNDPTGRRKFKCEICSERFRSGQALGGHMRKHYQKPVDIPIPDGGASAHAPVDDVGRNSESNSPLSSTSS